MLIADTDMSKSKSMGKKYFWHRHSFIHFYLKLYVHIHNDMYISQHTGHGQRLVLISQQKISRA